MGSIPNPRTWVDREIPPYDVLAAEVYGTVAWLLEPPMVKLRQTTAQNIATATSTALTFQTEDTDPYNWHNQTTPTRVTPTFPGIYRGWFTIGFSSSASATYRAGWVQKNGGAGRGRRDTEPAGVGLTTVLRGIPFFMSFNGTTDYLEVFGYQDSGATMALNTGSNVQSELFLRWWGTP